MNPPLCLGRATPVTSSLISLNTGVSKLQEWCSGTVVGRLDCMNCVLKVIIPLHRLQTCLRRTKTHDKMHSHYLYWVTTFIQSLAALGCRHGLIRSFTQIVTQPHRLGYQSELVSTGDFRLNDLSLDMPLFQVEYGRSSQSNPGSARLYNRTLCPGLASDCVKFLPAVRDAKCIRTIRFSDVRTVIVNSKISQVKMRPFLAQRYLISHLFA